MKCSERESPSREMLVVIPTDRLGGAERVAVTVVTEALQYVDRVHVIILCRGRIQSCWEGLGEKVVVHYLKAGRELTGAFRGLAELWRLRKHRFALSFTTHANCSALVSFAARLGIVKIDNPVFRECNTLGYLNRKQRFSEHVYYSLYLPRAVKLFQSEGLKAEFQNAFAGARRGVAISLPNPVPIEKIRAMADAVAELPFAPEFPFVISVGWLRPGKRHDLLIEAFAKFRDLHRDWHLLILGDGPERARLEALVDRFGLAGVVHLPGYVQNPYPAMARAKMGVMCSDKEGFPNALLEMMYLCPAVVSTLCSFGVDKLPGILTTPPGDAGALAQAMEKAAAGACDHGAMLAEIARRTPSAYWNEMAKAVGFDNTVNEVLS
jgi:glycosyltransferase involved in cell wall biosynthesis